MRNKLVAGNWKMHGSRAENLTRLTQLANADLDLSKYHVAVIPPLPYLEQCQNVLLKAGIELGAQNVSEFEVGAYTGEVSAEMLGEFDCKYALVGHSERRSLFNESNEQVADKFIAAQKKGIIPILCVGETLEQRESGVTEKVVSAQIAAVIQKAGICAFKDAVIAYEPVWAIGTGKTATPEQAQAVHKTIRQLLGEFDADTAKDVKVLYGGSVKANNAKDIFAQSDVDGALVGGASLIAEDFIQICKAAG